MELTFNERNVEVKLRDTVTVKDRKFLIIMTDPIIFKNCGGFGIQKRKGLVSRVLPRFEIIPAITDA